MQILHLESKSHWITISGWCEDNEIITIDVYDSMNSNILNQELISQISSFFKGHENLQKFMFVFHRVSHQIDGSSCGVHAIANAIVLCNHGLPEFYI